MLEPSGLALRGMALGFLGALWLASLSLPGHARRALWPLLACAVGYVVRSAPQASGWSVGVLLPLSIAALLFPVGFWWLVHNAFDDRADLPAWVGPAAAVLLASGLLPPTLGPSQVQAGADIFQKLVGAGFVGAALVRLWRGRVGDLVAGRRTARHLLLAYIGAHGLVVLGVELALQRQAPPPWLDALNMGVIALALAATLALLLGFRAAAVDMLFGNAPMPAKAGAASLPGKTSVVAADTLTADPDAGAVARLDRLMTVERVYRDPELSLTALAKHCGLPEYRLREVIHDRLGFRNLPSFVNEHRLREVEQRLADPQCDRLPILTLALEAGFGSIGPFNRAFRDRHDTTPSAYRSARTERRPGTETANIQRPEG
jgi:AraC-like DNA-binding protein